MKRIGTLLNFVVAWQAYFGPEVCTINMHMRLHLRQCLLDYGPIYRFWCFPYERYNDKLGDYATNCKGNEKETDRLALPLSLKMQKPLNLGRHQMRQLKAARYVLSLM